MSYFFHQPILSKCKITRGLIEVVSPAIGVGEGPVGSIPPKVEKYRDYIQVPRLFDEQSLMTMYCMQKQSHRSGGFMGTFDFTSRPYSSKVRYTRCLKLFWGFAISRL